MKKFPRILCLGVSAMVTSAPFASAANYQWTSSTSGQYWSQNAATNWNQNLPWAGSPGSDGPGASDNLDLAGTVQMYMSNGGNVSTVKNYAINQLTSSAAGQEIRGFSAVNASLTANSISVSGNGASLTFFRGNSAANPDAYFGIDTNTLSIGAGATLQVGRWGTTANFLIEHFDVAQTTTVSGHLANSARNTIAINAEINLGDLIVNSGGTVGLAEVESGISATVNATTVLEARSLAGGGAIFGSNVATAGARSATLNIEMAASSNAVFSGTLANSLVASAGTNLLNLTVSGEGRQTFTGGASTYTGTTSIQNATLAVAVLGNGGSASSIGASGASAANLVIDGGTLEYIGGTASTDRLFTVGANGATLNASGSGTITYSATNAVTYSVAGDNALGFSGTGAGVFAGRINNHATSGVTSVSKADSGTWVLSGSHGYTGATNVTGGKLIVDGFINASSGVNVGEGATLGGHGRVSRISGAGTVAVGNSPGILTGNDVDATSGLDFAFEFTTQATAGVSLPTFGNVAASGNDVLRLTDATPFEFSLTSSNTITVDFSSVTLADGDVYRGGFYGDAGDFWSQIENAQFVYSGISGFTITVSTVQQSANFGAGLVNGYITEFNVQAVPEPGSVVLFGLSAIGVAIMLRRRSAR